MDQAGFIVGIDFGTSKIVGVLGRKNEQGVITILASESVPADTCMKYGVIYNIDEAAGKVKKLINLLENKVGKRIGKAYVSISGRSLRAIDHTESKVLDQEEPITFAMLDSMEQHAKQTKPEFHTNYGVLAPEYYLDGTFEEDPIDKTATAIDAHYRLITGRPNIKNNIVKVLTEKAGIPIAGFIVGPVSSAVLVLDEADRQAGCALVEFGAGTTTLSIYKDGLLKYLTVIPFGGKTITKDIQALGFVQEAAESYKIRYGRLGKKKDKNVAHGVVNSDVDVKELNKVIQLREDEIIFNIIHQIKESGLEDQLEAGIIVIGGASQLAGLPEYFADKSGMPVKRGAVKRVYINNAAELAQNPVYTQALGILLFANENCEKKEEPKPEIIEKPEEEEVLPEEPAPIKREEPVKHPKKEKKKDGRQRSIFDFFEKMQNFGGTMFKEEDEDEEEDENEDK